jgi:predicted ATPase
MLLVLDNFEHLLSAAGVVSNLLARCESVIVVTTSRERLQLRGEHVVPVHPLDTGTATSLFLERARETNVHFDSSGGSQSIIAAICQKLEGVPLAIELAAARTRTLPPAALLERLDPMLPVLTSGPRDVPERQRTIRNTIAWSYDLLPPREQALFESIAVFTGGASLEAIGEVAAPDESAFSLPLSMVESLLDKSLIRETIDESGTLRITMLEIIREFSAERLESSGNAAATRQAHAIWFHDLCRSAEQDLRYGNNQARWFATITREIGNVRTALAWFRQSGDGTRLVQMAAALDEYWFAHSLYREVLDWLQAGLGLEPSLADSDLGWALCTAASASRILQDVPGATDYVSRAELVAGRANDPFLTGRTLLARAALHQVAREWNAAAALCLQAKPAFEQAGAMNYLALMSVEIGHMLQQSGDFDGAAREIDEGLALMRATGDTWATAMALEIRGHLAVFQSDLDLARDRLGETIAMGSQVGDDRTVLGAIAGIARIALAKGNPDDAAVLLGAIASKTEKGAGIPALTRPMIEPLVEQCRNALEPERFQRDWESGYVMTTEELITFALAPPGQVRISLHRG